MRQPGTNGERSPTHQKESNSTAASRPARQARSGHRAACGGVIHIRAAQELGPYHDKLSQPLEHWAKIAPDRLFLAQRDAKGEWRKLTYSQVLSSVKRIGAALLRRGLSADKPIVVLSGNDIEHALLGLAAMYVGIPYAPISAAYSLMSSDFGKLRTIINLLTPGLVFANDGSPFARAIYETVPDDIELVVARNPLGDRKTTLFADLRWRGRPRGRCRRACKGDARQHRQVPVHIRFNRESEGRHQYPSHAVLEPGDARLRFHFRRR